MASPCANCGEPVALDFCPACGQAAEDRRRPLVAIVGDFLSEFFSLDGRHLRTASRLWIPGELTRLYLQGKRASYVAPVRVYFVTSLLFFLLVGFPAPDVTKYNVFVNDVLVGREEPDPDLGRISLLSLDESSAMSPLLEPYLPTPEKFLAMPAQELVDRFFAGLERTVPTALILFVPFLALALKLLYWRQPFYYVDHLVFSLHGQSFLFTLQVLSRFANGAGLGQLYPELITYVAAFFLIGPVYLLFALRRVYRQSWLWTVLKTGALLVLYLLIIEPILGLTLLVVFRGM